MTSQQSGKCAGFAHGNTVAVPDLNSVSERRATRLNTAVDMLAITFLWCISLAAVNPLGDFPLVDDWSFGLTVKHFVESGEFLPTGWTSMPLITNVLWGSLFCLPAGFSFNALRLSTLVLSLLGVFGTYFLMKELRQPRYSAVMAALVVGFNPIYYALSNTFMTDVPCTAIAVFAALFYVRNLRSCSDLDLLAGTILAVAATLSRQIAVCIPMAFAVALILRRGIKGRNTLRAAVPLTLCLVALLLLGQWLRATGRLPAWYDEQNAKLLHLPTTRLIFSVTRNTYMGVLYLGWFLMPVLILAVASILRLDRKKSIVLFATSTGLLAMLCGGFAYRGYPSMMPLTWHIIVKSGIGPLMLRDTLLLRLRHMPELPHSFWWAVTAIGLLGGTLLSTVIGVGVSRLAPRLRTGKMDGDDAARAFLLLSVLIYLLPLLAAGFYDRYLIFTIPFLAVCIAAFSSHAPGSPRACQTVSRFTAVALLFASCLFAILGTRDYLTWNRVRWKALRDLIETGSAKAEQIDGGFEFNGLYLYDDHYQRDSTKSWWWVQGDTFLVAFGDVPGYRVFKQYSYHRWMLPCVGKVVVLQRDTQ